MCMTGGIGRWRIATEEVGVAGEGVRVKGGGLGKIEILIEPFSSSLLSNSPCFLEPNTRTEHNLTDESSVR